VKAVIIIQDAATAKAKATISGLILLNLRV
jgi:hypothetical protein